MLVGRIQMELGVENNSSINENKNNKSNSCHGQFKERKGKILRSKSDLIQESS